MQAPQVTVAPAIQRVVGDWDEFTGHFEAVNSVEVRPRVGGFVQHVGFSDAEVLGDGRQMTASLALVRGLQCRPPDCLELLRLQFARSSPY